MTFIVLLLLSLHTIAQGQTITYCYFSQGFGIGPGDLTLKTTNKPNKFSLEINGFTAKSKKVSRAVRLEKSEPTKADLLMISKALAVDEIYLSSESRVEMLMNKKNERMFVVTQQNNSQSVYVESSETQIPLVDTVGGLNRCTLY